MSRFIKAHGIDGDVMYVNMDCIEAVVQQREDGGADLWPSVGEGVVYEVRETPEQIMQLMEESLNREVSGLLTEPDQTDFFNMC